MKFTFFTLLLCLCCAVSPAQGVWKLRRDEDGIKVFTTNTINSDFKSIKVECTVKATLPALIAFLMDIDKQHDWVYNTRSSQLLKQLAPNEVIFYAEVSVPWPGTNRDYVAHFTINQVSPSLTIIDSRAEPDLLPEKEGLIRVRRSVAHWQITTVSPDVQQIVYTVSFDPAGAIPAWLTNLFVTKGPFQTFQQLRAGVAAPAYRHAHVDFIKE